MKYIRTALGFITVSVIAPLYTFAQQWGPGFNNQNAFSFPQYYQTGSGFGGGAGMGGSFYGQTRGLQITSFQGVLGIINTLLGYMQVGIFLVALFYFLYGAYLMVKGDIADGGKMLMNAAIGAGAAILAFSIIPFVCFVTQSSGPACWL